MPYVDKTSGAIVIRIVYDGPPEAGKTTNVLQLSQLMSAQRRGTLASPGTSGERTAYFDWLDFLGGYVDGRRVQCQLLSVPGQAHLAARRRALLETADALVFVSDSRREHLEAERQHLEQTLQVTGGLDPPIGLVWQANQQDRPDAVPPHEVPALALLPPGTAAVGSSAQLGQGVMQTFVLAVRMATDRARLLLGAADLAELPTAARSPEELYRALAAVDTDAPSPSAESAAVGEPVHVPEAAAQNSHNRVRTPWPPLPNATTLGSGHIWPPVVGRGWLSQLDLDRLWTPKRLMSWAPHGAWEWQDDGRWVLHTAEQWLFDEEQAARHALIRLARAALAGVLPVPEGRTLAVAPDGDGYRLWVLTPHLRSFADTLEEAASLGDFTGVEELFVRLEQALGSAESAGSVCRGLRGIGFSRQGTLWQLALADGSQRAVVWRDEVSMVLEEMRRRWPAFAEWWSRTRGETADAFKEARTAPVAETGVSPNG